MPYKDEEKRKEAQRERTRRYRDKAKGVTSEGVTQGVTEAYRNKSTSQISHLAIGVCWCCGNRIPDGTVCCGPCAWSGKAKAERAGRYPPLLTDRTPEQMETDLCSLTLTGGYHNGQQATGRPNGRRGLSKQ